jgi:GNAT superfamily N-acetyltransferase
MISQQLLLEDLRGSLGSRELREVLLALDYPADIQQSKADKIIASYRNNPDWPLIGAWIDATLVALIGFEFAGAGKAEIRHIAVLAEHRHTGIGTRLVTYALNKYSLDEVGYSLLARCESSLIVTDGLGDRPVCPIYRERV